MLAVQLFATRYVVPAHGGARECGRIFASSIWKKSKRRNWCESQKKWEETVTLAVVVLISVKASKLADTASMSVIAILRQPRVEKQTIEASVANNLDTRRLRRWMWSVVTQMKSQQLKLPGRGVSLRLNPPVLVSQRKERPAGFGLRPIVVESRAIRNQLSRTGDYTF